MTSDLVTAPDPHYAASSVQPAPLSRSRPSASVPSEAVRRLWWLIALLGLVGLLAGLLAANRRTAVFTASGDVRVGQGDLRTQSLPGYAEGARNLASAYSRFAESQVLLKNVARARGITLADATAKITSTPIPESPIFRIQAQSSTEKEAVELDGAALDATLAYIRDQVGNDAGAAQEAFRRFQAYSRSAASREVIAEQLSSRRARNVPGVTFAQVAQARSRRDQTALLRDTYGQRYQNLVAASSSSFKGAEILFRPLDATSDVSSARQRYGFAGLAGGLVVGLGLALLLVGRQRRRSPSVAG